MTKPTITPWAAIPVINFQEYERYLPTAFDGELSLLQKVNKLIKYVNDIGTLLNGIGTQWNEIVEWVTGEGLETSVNDKLTEWLNDGTLSQILSQLIDALPFINLKQYIEANGVTQTIGFQDCLDIAKLTDDGVHIIIPPMYTITTQSELIVYSNTKITAGPGSKIIRDHDGYILLNGIRGSVYSGYNGFGNIHIVGGTWDVNGVTRSATASGIAFAHAKELTFRDMVIKDANSHFIEVNSSMNVLFDRVKCLGFSINSSNTLAEAIQIDYSNLGGFSAFGAYDGTMCKNVKWKECYFGPSGTIGTTTPSRGMGSHSGIVGRWHENIEIESCTFENVIDYNIQCYNWKKVKIHHNDMVGGEGGIIVYVPYKTTDQVDVNGNTVTSWQDVMDYDIHDNTFSSIKTKNHIRIYGTENAKVRDVHIHHNTLKDAIGNAACIYATYFENVNVNNNILNNVQNTGISASFGTQFKASGNTGKDLNGNGISVTGTVTDVTIHNNSFEDIDNHGILLSDNVTEFVISNNRTKNVNRLNTDNDHIHIVTSCMRGSLLGNVAKDGATLGNYALFITNTCSDIVRTGNVFKGVGSIGVVYDNANVSIDKGDLI